MKSKRVALGELIHIVDERNKDMLTDTVLGISIDKEFIPSVANTIGTDLSNYKIVHKGRFACNPMHVGRDERLPVCLYSNEQPAIVSPAYFLFECNQDADIVPEYLNLCFHTDWFDKNCWLRTDCSVRGGISWDDLCLVDIPIPPIEEQRKIVRQYKVITDRIDLLIRLDANLDKQINAIFLENCIRSPDVADWTEGTLGTLVENSITGDWGEDVPSENFNTLVKCFRGADMPELNIGITSNAPTRYILKKNASTKQLMNNDFIVEISGGSPIQSTGRISIITSDILNHINTTAVCSNFCRGLRVVSDYTMFFFLIWKYLYANKVMFAYENSTTGLKNFDLETFLSQEKVQIAPKSVAKKINTLTKPLQQIIIRNGFEIETLKRFRSLLLSHLH